jgi:hypothetical protein
LAAAAAYQDYSTEKHLVKVNILQAAASITEISIY